MRVRFLKLASKDLISILGDLSEKNPAAAERFESRIREVADRVNRYPNSFQNFSDRPGVRRAPLQRYPYLMFYKVIADEVVILRIMHGARDKPEQFL